MVPGGQPPVGRRALGQQGPGEKQDASDRRDARLRVEHKDLQDMERLTAIYAG